MTKGRIAVALGSLYFAKSGGDNPRFRAARKAVGQDARGAPRAAGREPGLRGPAWTVTYGLEYTLCRWLPDQGSNLGPAD